MSEASPPPAADGAPAEVLELASACVRFVEEALGLELDYTPETLPILDHYLIERGRGAEPGVKQLLAPAAGAYFGEVVRRELGAARWHCPGDDYARYRLELTPVFLCFNPVGAALEALQGQDAPGYAAHFQVLDEARETVERALEVIDDVRDEDHYRLAVRYEALLQVAAALSALERQQGSPRVFGPEVYRAVNGEDTDGRKPS